MKKFNPVWIAAIIFLLIAGTFVAGASEKSTKQKTKTYVSNEFKIAKDFKACKLYKEYSNFKIPNLVVKIYQKPGKTLYEAHFGKLVHNGNTCTLFYEKDSKYCAMYCITPMKQLIEKPPIPYAKILPKTTIRRIVNKYSLHPNWPEKIPALNAKSLGKK